MNQVKYGAPRDSKEPGTSINSCTLDGVDIRRCGYQKAWTSIRPGIFLQMVSQLQGVVQSSWDISV